MRRPRRDEHFTIYITLLEFYEKLCYNRGVADTNETGLCWLVATDKEGGVR